MTVNLNRPAIVPGQIDAARRHSTGTVRLLPAGCGQQRWPERRVNWPDTVPTDHAPMAAEACTDLGADTCRPPATRRGIALVVLPWALGVIGWAAWARWPLF